MSARVEQLSDSLERWRWLPNEYVNAQLMVNLPEFLLRGYEGTGADRKEDFQMKVVDGKVVGEHQTPVFVQHMKVRHLQAVLECADFHHSRRS